MKKVGILGGTFDPPHIGHLIIAQEVMYKNKLDEIWFIPTNKPPHKEHRITSNRHRKEMLTRALASNESFHLNDIELKREGPSYTYDTICELYELYNGVEFHFIIGADMIEYLPKWYKIDDLMKIITFIGVKRPEYQVNTNYPITLVDAPLLDISSSNIRERIQKQLPITYFVPSSVETYIKEFLLYES